MKLRAFLVLPLAFLALSATADAKAAKAKAHTRDVASVSDDEEEDAPMSGLFMKVDGLDGKSGVTGYETYYKLKSFNLDGRRENVTDKILAKKTPVDPAKKDTRLFQPGMYASVNKDFDPRTSIALQKMMFMKSTFQAKIVILSRGKVAVEYTLKDAFFTTYSVSHQSPERGFDQPDGEYLDVSFAGYHVTAPKSKDTISEKEE